MTSRSPLESSTILKPVVFIIFTIGILSSAIAREPVYTGPVYVLISKRTASAAELATDALRGSGRALVIGENTAGEMLSQKIFDLPGGFHLSLPVEDYYSISNGRIEGSGIKPAIGTDAADALNTALSITLGNGS